LGLRSNSVETFVLASFRPGRKYSPDPFCDVEKLVACGSNSADLVRGKAMSKQ
jgi:hypothetical protein